MRSEISTQQVNSSTGIIYGILASEEYYLWCRVIDPRSKVALPRTAQGSSPPASASPPCTVPRSAKAGSTALLVAHRFDPLERLCRTIFFIQTKIFQMTQATKKQPIDTGQFFMTAGISRAIANSSLFSRFVLGSFGRHKYRDWGDVSKHDQETNDYALEHGGRIICSYNIPTHLRISDGHRLQTKIWIITEACRSYTTALFPSEY